jgi:hypothetical protein
MQLLNFQIKRKLYDTKCLKRLKCEKWLDTDDNNDRDRCKMMKILTSETLAQVI